MMAKGSKPPWPTSHQYSQAMPAPVRISISMGRIQKPAPCRADSRRSPNQPTIGIRSPRRRHGADGFGRDHGLSGRRFHASRVRGPIHRAADARPQRNIMANRAGIGMARKKFIGDDSRWNQEV